MKHRLLHRLAVGCWYAFAALVITAAVLIGVSRLLLPWADRLRGDVEAWVSTQFGRPVTVEAFDAVWRGASPVLRLRGIRLLDKQAGGTLLSVDELRIAVSLYDSLRTARIMPSGFQVKGVHLAIERHADGTVALQGFKPADEGSINNDAVEWLLGQGRLHVQGGEIIWRDARTGARPLRFSNVDFSLRNRGSRRQINGSADLPGQLGRRFEFVLELQEGAKTLQGWAGDLYLNASSVQLAGWPLALPGAVHVAGAADVELWTEWRQARPVKVEGRVGVHNLEIAGGMQDAHGPGRAVRRVAVDQAQGQILWRREASGWQLEVNKFNLARGGRSWPETRLSAAAVTNPEGRLLSVQAQASYVALEDAVALLQAGPWPPERLQAFLAGVQPHGELHELQFSYRAQDGDPALSLQTRFDRAGGQAWQAFPAVDGLSGILRADERSGVITLDSRAARAEFPRLFRNPLEAALLSGTLAWERDAGTWRLHSDELVANNADIRTRTRVAVEIPGGGASPFLDLQVAFDEGEVSHAYRYLPVGIMDPGVVEWLDRALVSGRVTSGTALFHGQLKDFPFDQGTGKFEVRFNVADVILDYQPRWPRIEELEAEVEFSGRSMFVRAVGGKIFNADLLQVQAEIPALQHHARLIVQGRVRGPVADMLRVLKEGPLSEKYGAALEGVRTEGGALLNLNLDLALYKGGEDQVSGSVDLRNAAFMAERWNVALTQVAGPLTFSRPGLTAQSLKARLFGQKVQLQISPIDAGTEKAGTEVKVHGPDLAGLASHFRLTIPPYVQGNAEWDARLRIRPGARAWQDPAIQLALESDLDGVSVSLPEPLGKTAEQVRTLVIRTSFPATDPRVVAIHYEGLLDGLLELQGGADAVTLRRGVLRFGGGEVSLPSNPGLQITGRLQRVSLVAWQDWLNTSASGPDAGLAERLNFLDLSVGRLAAFRQTFEDIRVAAQKTASEWVVRVEGADAAGTIRVPYPWTDAARVVMDFEHLRLQALQPGEQEQKSPLSPRSIPALQISSKRLIYGTSNFGSLDLQVSPRPDGIHLDQLLLQSPAIQVKAQGNWAEKQGRQNSDFEIEVDSANLAGALELLGYEPVVEGSGPAHVEIKAAWPGAPSQFAPERMDGRLSMVIGKGRFLDIEPGVGRVFGLLSLNALPRRLTLDFSDLLRKGFTFDRIEGHFSITGGDAYTHDLYMEGPSAHVDVVGRTGLSSRDYDQIVTVTPRIGNTLPIAGMLAGGPSMGVMLFLAEKLFGTQIDRASRVQYTVNGSWDAPVIERIQSSSKTPEEAEY